MKWLFLAAALATSGCAAGVAPLVFTSAGGAVTAVGGAPAAVKVLKNLFSGKCSIKTFEKCSQ